MKSLINEKLLREKLAKLLDRSTYQSLHTFTRNPLIDNIVEAVKTCEKEAAAKTRKVKRALKEK